MLVKQFEKIHQEKRQSLVIISHQERLIQIADRIMVLDHGEISVFGKREEVLPSLMHSSDAVPYTHLSISSAISTAFNAASFATVKIVPSFGFITAL